MRGVLNGNGAVARPGLAVIGRAFDPGGPGAVALDGSAADDHAAAQNQGFGADRAVKAGGKVFGG